jgi:hypothetical protein
VPQPATGPLRFAEAGPVLLVVDFWSGRLTSDGGLAWLAGADAAPALQPAIAIDELLAPRATRRACCGFAT